MVGDVTRHSILTGAAAVGTIGWNGRAGADDTLQRATAISSQSRGSTSMTPYIGKPTSRVDGIARVTGLAKYAGEFNVPGLAHAYVVGSTIPKGGIKRLDTSEALRVGGVLDVLTHENRPHMADTDQAYKDDVAPEGSPYRPLYDGKIMFDGQPIALVVAETWEIARFAASLVRVEYDKEAHVTDVFRQRDAAVPVKASTNPMEAMFAPPK